MMPALAFFAYFLMGAGKPIFMRYLTNDYNMCIMIPVICVADK